MVYRLNGKLVIPDGRYEYGLFENSTTNIKYISIDRFLDYIYKNSPSANVIVKVKKRDRDNNKNFKLLFFTEGELFKAKNRNGVYDWHIGNYRFSRCLGDVLFDNVDEYVQVTIDDVDYKKYVTDTKLLEELLYGADS